MNREEALDVALGQIERQFGKGSVMRMSERIKEMAIDQASEAEIAVVAKEEGMLTLREDGVAKVRGGQTSLEEISRVVDLTDRVI